MTSTRKHLHGLVPALGLTVRRLRVQASVWVLSLWALTCCSPSYLSVYPSLESRTDLIAAMRQSPGTRVMYGIVPLPGTIGQIVQWEIGTWLVVCTGLMAVLMTCRLRRADEESGLFELVRGTGAGSWVPFAAPLVTVSVLVAVLATGSGLIMTVLRVWVEELTLWGAWSLAAAVAVAGWGSMAGAAVACELARSASTARGLALAGLGTAFTLRVAADESGATWLRWFTPVAWRDLVAPYTADRFWAAGACGVLSLLVTTVAGVLHTRREYLSGYLPDFSTSRRRWAVGGHAGLLVRVAWRSVTVWTVAAACVATLFGAMSGGLSDLLSEGSATATMVDQMVLGSPVVQFVELLTIMIVLLAAVGTVSRAAGLATQERAGLVELEVAAGTSRGRLFLTQAAAALVQGTIMLGVAGAVLAGVTATQITRDHAAERALVFTVSQLPGLVAAIGVTVALVGLAPRRVQMVWLVLGWSAFARFFGGLVTLPAWAQDLSVIGHHLDVIGHQDWGPLLVQMGVGVIGTFVGWWSYRHRDLGA